MSARTWMAVVAAAALAAALGWWARARLTPGPAPEMAVSAPAASGPCPGGAKPLYWKAPMDPTYVRDAPGKSPMGMDLVPVCPGEEGGGRGVHIESSFVQSLGVRTAVAERRDLARKVRAVGRVAYDERRVSHVHTKVQGWVEKLHVDYAGQMVRRGEPLLEIYSPALVSTQEELLLAERYRGATEQSQVEDVARGGQALFEATRKRLELWDIPKREIERLLETGEVRKTLTLEAPTRGVVTELMVREGMEVGPDKNLYTIADLSRVWVYADVYEYELPWVAVGQKARVELTYLPGQSFEGTVGYVYPFLDPKTRTARVRLELENPDLVLKPDMFANVTLQTEVHPDALAVPEEAVIRSGKRSLVVVALPGSRFEPRDVHTGIDSGDGWLEITSGLAPGDRVVTSGQFLIDSESNLREAAQKLLAAKVPESEVNPAPPPAEGEPAAPEASPAHEGHAMPPGGEE